jgi:TolA-binding protein
MRSVLLAAIVCAAPALAAPRPVSAAPAPAPAPAPVLQQPDGYRLPDVPRAFRRYDEAAAKRRLAEIERVLVHMRGPIGRANARLDRATLRAARAHHEMLVVVGKMLERDEAMLRAREKLRHAPADTSRGSDATARDRAAIALDRAELERTRARFDDEIKRLRTAMDLTRATAIDELTEVVCDPDGRGAAVSSGLACPAPPWLTTWPDLDEALHRLAYVLLVGKRTDDAVRVYRRIVDETPRSPHRVNALVELAEHAFDQADHAAAERLYRAALTAPAPPDPEAAPLRAYAAYKLAWALLNLGRGREAFATLATVPALAATATTATTAATAATAATSDKYLARTARRDLARVFATYGAPADAFTALEAAAPGHGIELTARLGQQWLEEKRTADAIAVYRELLQRAPDDPRRCEWQAAIASAMQAAGDLDALIPQLESLAAANLEVRGEPAGARCAIDTTSLLEEVARKQLSTAWTRRGTPQMAEYAERLYAAYVRAFPADAAIASARLHRAEAALIRAEKATGAQAAVLWRRAAARFDEALRGGGLEEHQRASALRYLARARKRATER